jgi:hypothetical protein
VGIEIDTLRIEQRQHSQFWKDPQRQAKVSVVAAAALEPNEGGNLSKEEQEINDFLLC